MFAAPSFGSDRDNAVASLLNAILWVTIGGASLFQVFQLYAGIDPARIGAVGTVLALACVAMVTLRRRNLRGAAWLVTCTLFGTACVSIGLGGGIHAPGVSTLLIVLLMSAMALGRQPTLLWTFLSIGALSGFALAETWGWLPPVGPRRPPLELWFIYSLHVSVAAWLVSDFAGAFRGVLGALGVRSTALADSEERYTQLVEQSPDAIVALDENGVVRECSPAVEKLFGYPSREVIGKPFRELGVIPQESLAEKLDVFHSLLDGEAPPLVETKVIHRDGGVRWAETNARIVPREDGGARIHVVARDITARVEAERQREALERQLAEARRLEALGRMAGALAHDFNNLLLVILANAELLERRAEPPDAPLLEEIRVAGESAAELTGQLLAFAGRQVQEEDSVDVVATLGRVDGLLNRLLPPSCTLEIRTDGRPLAARCDPAQLQQVIVNLVMNAQQAMPDGGTIEVVASDARVSQEDCRRYPGASPGPHVRLAVTDTGRGMDDETAEHIFEPFYTRREGGTGLGLATVHGIVTQSGGHVRVHSRLGAGTRFEVLLPSAPESAGARAAPLPLADSTGDRSVVLLVDDDAAVLSSVGRLLESQGFRVLRAQSPEQARAASDREPGRIHLLLTDVLLPGTSGPKLAAELVERRPGIRVLLMSGHTEDQLEELEVLRGAVSFIAKPFSSQALARKIRELRVERAPREPSAPSAGAWAAPG